MPNRIIKESICTSEKVAALKDFEFRLWIGLITQADDAGRGDARPAILKGRIFPLRDQVTAKGITDALDALATVGLVSLYKVGGKPIYWLPGWAEHQRIRDCKPKFPGPEEADEPLGQSAASCGELPQSAASCGLNPIRIQSESESNPNPKGICEPPCASTAPAQIGYGEIQAMYNELCPSLPRCQALSEARKKAIKARLSSGYTPEDFRRLFERAEASGFLKGRNDRNWTANFDWLLKDANMAKVLDGNYDDHGGSYGRRGNAVQAKPSGQRELDEAEREAIRRLMEENA